MNHLTINPVTESLMDGDKHHIVRGCLEWVVTGRTRQAGAGYARSVIQDRLDVGANTLMVGTMLSWGPRMSPKAEGEGWWENLTVFFSVAEEKGMRIVPIVFADTALMMPDPGEQNAHWDRFQHHVNPFSNIDLILIANQPGHPTQAMRPADTLRFQKLFPHLLIGRENPFEGANPIEPAADWSGYCPYRDVAKYQSIGSSGWYVKNGWPEAMQEWNGTGGLVYHTEMPRIEASNPWNSPKIWKEIGRTIGFQGVIGMNMYSRFGITGDMLSGSIKDCYVEGLGNVFYPDQMSR